MNLHLVTIIYICAFIGVSALIAFGISIYPIFTLTTFGIVMFASFYHLIYSFLKMEHSIKELKKQ